MPTTRVRLTAIGPGKWLLLAIGVSVSGLFAWYSLQGVLAPADPWWMRLLAAVFTVLFVAPWIVLPTSVRTRLRWMELDDRGLRLVRGNGTAFTDLRWDELAGLGVMVDEAAAQHELRGKYGLYRRIMHRVPSWLELVPAGTAVVRAHSELGAPVPAGDGQPARWMVQLNRGWARRPQVGEHVARLRPDLWQGERHGSTPRAAGQELRRAAGVELRRTAGPRPPAAPIAAAPPPEPAAAGSPQVVELPRDKRVGRSLTAVVVTIGILVLVFRLPDVPGWITFFVAAYTSMVLVVALGDLLLPRPPRRLVADGESLRLVVGSRGSAWRIPWSDVAAVGLERRGDRTTLVVRPISAEAVDAHPLLDSYVRPVGRIEWQFALGRIGSQRRAVRELVLRCRPELWVEDTVRPT